MGFQGSALRTRPFQGLPASGFFNPLGKGPFSNNNRFTGSSKNKRGTRAHQAPDGGDDGPPCEIAQGRSRTPAFRRRPIAAGWDGIFSGSTEAAVSRTKSEQNQARSSRGIFESRLPRPSRRIPTQSAAAPLHGYYDCYRYLPFAGPLQNDRTISLQPGIPK
jgi:hypothetical protein